MKVIKFNELPLSAATVLWNAAFSDYSVPINMTETDLSNRLTSLALSGEQSMIVQIDGQNAGIMLMGSELHKGEKHSWIGGMGVHPTFRGKGVAKGLLHLGMRTAKEMDSKQLLLEVISSNLRAETLYRISGFKELTKLVLAQGKLTETYQHAEQVVLKEQLSASKLQQLESVATPWQNRLTRGYLIQEIFVEQVFLGYLYYVENKLQEAVVSLTIKQLVLSEHRSELVAGILIELAKLYGEIPCSISNLDCQLPETTYFKQLGFVEQLQQKQLVYKITCD